MKWLGLIAVLAGLSLAVIGGGLREKGQLSWRGALTVLFNSFVTIIWGLNQWL